MAEANRTRTDTVGSIPSLENGFESGSECVATATTRVVLQGALIGEVTAVDEHILDTGDGSPQRETVVRPASASAFRFERFMVEAVTALHKSTTG